MICLTSWGFNLLKIYRRNIFEKDIKRSQKRGLNLNALKEEALAKFDICGELSQKHEIKK